MKRTLRVGVYSSAVDGLNVSQLARKIGSLIAEQGWTIVTGACKGLPQEAVEAAHAIGGKAIGFSPTTSEKEHQSRGYPFKEFSKIHYIPNDYEHKDKAVICLKYRNVPSVAYTDASIFLAGRCGTLNEFTNAYDMEKVIGVLVGTGGVSDHIKELIEIMNKKTGAVVFFDKDPESLIMKIKNHVELQQIPQEKKIMVVNNMNMADKILNKVDEVKNPSIVGLDPRFEKIPDFITKPMIEKYGKTLKAVSESFLEFNKRIIDNVKDIVGFVKPQTAFYEQAGPDGVLALRETIKYAKSKGMIVILDAKRNDIGSTARAYAEAYLGGSPVLGDERPFDVDMITVTPYLGSEGVNPFVGQCSQSDTGIFILVKTSNESAGELQDLKVEGEPVHNIIARHVNEWGKNLVGTRGYTSIGAVVGATYPEDAITLRKLMPKSIFLVPGYGAQGGTAKDVIPCFNEDGYGALINSSRGIIFNYPDTRVSEEEFNNSVRTAALKMRDNIREALQNRK